MPEKQRHLLVALGFAAALITALWIVDYVPTGDGPNHALTGYLTVALHDPQKGYEAFLVPGHARSALFFHALYAAFLRVLPWQPAQQLTLTAGALLWAFGLGSVATALHPRRAVLGLLGFATAFSWTFYVGLFSYWMTLGAGLALLGAALRIREPRPWHRALLTAALALMVFAHSFAAMLMGALLGILVLVRGGPRGRPREIALLALTGLPAVLLALLSARGAARLVDPVAGADPLVMEWLPAVERLRILWSCFTGGPLWRGAIPLAAALLGLGALAVRARRASREELAVGAMAAALLLTVLFTPIHLAMWQVFSPRFLPWGMALSLCLLPVEEIAEPGLRRAAHLAFAAFALASIAWAGAHHVALAAKHADVLALAAEPIRRHGPRLPLGLVRSEGSVMQVDDVSNFGQIVALEQGGVTPYLFAARPELHPFVWKKPSRELFPPYPSKFFGQALLEPGATSAPRGVHLAQLAQAGAAGWEDVILWGLPGDVEAFVERGYEIDARRGNAALLRYRSCGLAVEVKDAEGAADPLIVQYGWAPLSEPAGVKTWPDGAAAERSIRFPEAPCGPVWVRVAWDRDRNGKPSKADRFCKGADPNGRVHALLARGGAGVVRCE
jgi:hypothetical protein